MKKPSKLHFLLIVFLSLFFNNCYKPAKNDRDLQHLKTKFSIAIHHYSAPKDSLKLKALYFLLNNLGDQYFNRAAWLEAYNQAIIKSHNNSVNDLIHLQDSINQTYPLKVQVIKDENVINDSYLITNINRAFESRKYAWVKDVSFEDFCEYVLPYKVGNEKPERWGACLDQETYLRTDSISKIKDIFDATSYVNNHFNWYTGTLNYDYPVDIGYQLSRLIKTGTCYSLSRMIAFQSRALGLPVAIDYVPTWGNRSDGHSWNALIYKSHSYPFDANGPNIGFYKIEFKGIDRIPYKISKVFRRMFSIQHNSLPILNDSSEDIPAVFNDKRMKDVTNQYVPVSDVTLEYQKNFTNKFAYLCTFNNVSWIPSFWGEIDNHKITFRNMGRDILYLPVCYSNVKGDAMTVPIGNPFILLSNGQIKIVSINLKAKQTLIITRKYPEDESNKILKGDDYELFYWSGSWKSFGVQTATGNNLCYHNVPSDGLYWVKDLTQGKQERIFTYEHNQQVWW